MCIGRYVLRTTTSPTASWVTATLLANNQLPLGTLHRAAVTRWHFFHPTLLSHLFSGGRSTGSAPYQTCRAGHVRTHTAPSAPCSAMRPAAPPLHTSKSNARLAYETYFIVLKERCNLTRWLRPKIHGAMSLLTTLRLQIA